MNREAMKRSLSGEAVDMTPGVVAKKVKKQREIREHGRLRYIGDKDINQVLEELKKDEKIADAHLTTFQQGVIWVKNK